MGVRTMVQELVVDRLQFAIDRGLGLEYQPLPWVAIETSGRAGGSADRWALLRPAIERLDPSSAVDIGANVGYFAFRLAEMGVPCLAIESERRFVRLATYAAQRSGLEIAIQQATLNPDSMWLVPRADVVLLLSVYHHWIRHHSAEVAAQMLAEVWERCGAALVFETGEQEVPARFRGLDMGGDSERFLVQHLRSVVGEGPTITCLGQSRAFVPGEGDERSAPATRHLFLVER